MATGHPPAERLDWTCSSGVGAPRKLTFPDPFLYTRTQEAPLNNGFLSFPNKAGIAQSVERVTRNDEVRGSTPRSSSIPFCPFPHASCLYTIGPFYSQAKMMPQRAGENTSIHRAADSSLRLMSIYMAPVFLPFSFARNDETRQQSGRIAIKRCWRHQSRKGKQKQTTPPPAANCMFRFIPFPLRWRVFYERQQDPGG